MATSVTIEEKADHDIKKMVDDLIKNCNIDIIDDKKHIDKGLKKFFESVNYKLTQPKDKKDTTQSKDDIRNLIVDNHLSLLKSGHSRLENDKRIRELFNHCVTKCIKEEKLEYMTVIAVLLPELVKNAYKNIVSNIMMQLSYIKIPSKWCKEEESSTFYSIRENLWGYKFPDQKSSLSRFDRFIYTLPFSVKENPLHSATLCYVPLPGFCTYTKCTDQCAYSKCAKVFNFLVPHHLSPFAQLIISHTPELYDASHPSSKIYESAPFQAIVKFKWNTFAQKHFFIFIFLYFSHFLLFAMAIFKTNKTTEGRWLMIASMTIGAFMILGWIRYAIISIVNRSAFRFFTMPTTYFRTSVLAFPMISGFLFLKHSHNTALPALQYLAILFFWIGVIGVLLIFNHIGIFIIVVMQTCRKIIWLLLFLTVLLFAFAHSLMVLLMTMPKEGEGSDAFSRFDKAAKNQWSGVLGNFDSLKPWEGNFWVDTSIIVFSLFSTIITLNILIALVNNVYDEVNKRALIEWTTVRARFIVVIELLFMLPRERQKSKYFPSTITYEAITEVVDNWPEKLKKDKISNPWVDDKQIT